MKRLTPVSEPTTPDLNSRLEHWIDQRTGGRVHYLTVETTAGGIVVHGYTGSYHARQLALAAVLELLEASGSDCPEQVSLDILVGTSTSLPSEHRETQVVRSQFSVDVARAPDRSRGMFR